jgi:hypothetical protein
VTVLPRHDDLIRLFEDFGFGLVVQRTILGEVILEKPLIQSGALSGAPPIEFHIRYGPKNYQVEGVSLFVVPIQPTYHRMLFPDAEQQLNLLPGRHPFGNSIRKAYLSNSVTSIANSALVMFCSSTGQAMTKAFAASA